MTVLPLDGIRVLDLTVAWSGPGGTALLGDLGAEVIRVEHNKRASRQASASLTREVARSTGWHANMFPDRDPEPRPYDRYAMFNWHARNKLACSLNLDTPEGHAAFLELAAISDVFVENNTASTLDKLGLSAETLIRDNPRLVVARMPPMGLGGRMSDYLGYGPNFNSLVGIAAMDGYEGEGPETAGDNYHMDEASPAGLAFAVMAALWDRETTGRGGLIEFAQAENVMQDVGELFLDWQLNHRDPDIQGNADGHVLQDVFATSDVDRWVAVSIRDDRDWSALTQALGAPAWTELGATHADRRDRSAWLREQIGAWLAERAVGDIVATLAAYRVPVSEVMSENRLLIDPHLRDREWFQERSHPAIGTHRYPGHPWRAEGFDLLFGRPVPGFGEDNEYVYKTLLGYSDSVYDDLVERGLISGEQHA